MRLEKKFLFSENIQQSQNKKVSQRSTITLEQFLQDKNILHCDTSDNFLDSLRFLIENKCDIVTYNSSKTFSVQNIDLFEIDGDGNYFYEHSLSRQHDIVDNIRVECPENVQIKLSYIVNGEPYSLDEIDKYVLVSSPYSDVKIIFTFSNKFKPNNDYVFRLFMRYYIIQGDLKNNLIAKDVVVRKVIYKSGTCNRL